MKWHNHKILTAAVVFTATHNFISTIAATIGSIFPDLIEIWLKQGHHIDEIYEFENTTLLWHFISHDNISLEDKYNFIEFCLKKGADPNLNNGECVYTVIHQPTMNRKIMELLFSYGLDPCLRDEYLFASTLQCENDYTDLEKLSREELKDWILDQFI